MPDFIVVDDDLPAAATTGGPHRKPTTGLSRGAVKQRQVNRDSTAQRFGREIKVAKPSEAPDFIPEDANADPDDLAAVVVRKTNAALASGKLTPTLRDGLTAQQLLDRRAEKAADRKFMLNLAQAMAGGGYAPPAKLLPSPDETVIEGDFTEEDDQNLAPAHLRSEP